MRFQTLRRLSVALWAICVGNAFGGDEPKGHYFDSNGFRLHFLEQGSGETVLLLHGFTLSSEVWVETGIMGKLAKDFHVIALDARAHGKSDRPHYTSAYGAETARDVIRLLDHLQVEKAHVIASSFGVRVFGGVMAKHSNRFKTATLIGMTPIWEWKAEWQEPHVRRANRLINEPNPDLVKRGLNPKALGYLRLSFDQLVTSKEELRKVRLPTLFVFGSKEEIGISKGEELRDVMPDVRLFIIEGADHGETYRRPEFLPRVQKFLAEY